MPAPPTTPDPAPCLIRTWKTSKKPRSPLTSPRRCPSKPSLQPLQPGPHEAYHLPMMVFEGRTWYHFYGLGQPLRTRAHARSPPTTRRPANNPPMRARLTVIPTPPAGLSFTPTSHPEDSVSAIKLASPLRPPKARARAPVQAPHHISQLLRPRNAWPARDELPPRSGPIHGAPCCTTVACLHRHTASVSAWISPTPAPKCLP